MQMALTHSWRYGARLCVRWLVAQSEQLLALDCQSQVRHWATFAVCLLRFLVYYGRMR